MENMLTQDDLKQIGQIVGEQIEAKVPPMIKAGIESTVPSMIQAGIESTVPSMIQAGIESTVPSVIQAGIDGLEERMNIKFDAVQDQLESMENRLVTKDYLDRKLVEYVRKPA